MQNKHDTTNPEKCNHKSKMPFFRYGRSIFVDTYQYIVCILLNDFKLMIYGTWYDSNWYICQNLGNVLIESIVHCKYIITYISKYIRR